MEYLKKAEKLRKAEIYEEMKDLSNIRSILYVKKDLFDQRRFKLRYFILSNLKEIIKKQIKDIDEEYNLIGLDKECWIDEKHFIHDLEKKINKMETRKIKKQHKQKLIEKIKKHKEKEKKDIDSLLSLIKKYITILYNELNKIGKEDMIAMKKLIIDEEVYIEKIGKIINLEKREEIKGRKLKI
jgi:hypothetical protein